jgi:dipeptidyl aminopeptidase/acylaminoacyl peptidase
VGFLAGGELKKVPVGGGEPVALCEVRGASRAAWGPDNRIYFSPSTSKAIAWVSALGGAPEVLPAPEGAPVGLDSPEVLPGGEALLVRVFAGRESPIGILSLKSGKLVTLQERGIDPRYVASGHIVYIRGGGLMAVPFDLGRQQVTGPETQVVPGVVQYAVSRDGSLAYMQGEPPPQQNLVWVDRKGLETSLDLPTGRYGSFQLSPDGKRLALEVEAATVDVWVYELEHKTRVRLTHDGNNGGPVWTPNGERVAFCSDRGKTYALYSMKADGSGEASLLPSTKTPVWHAWSPDARQIAITDVSLGQPDIWILPMGEGAKPFPLRNSGSSEWGAAFSPDSRWIAYASDESGRFEIYVEPAPGYEGARQRVSSSGGEEPRWPRKGDELFYRNGRAWMVVPVKTQPSLTTGTPRVLFEGDYLKVTGIPYDVSPDGQRVLVLKPSRERASTPFLTLVLNWQAELKRLVVGR